MGHLKDAVVWWNEEGKSLPRIGKRPGAEIDRWMNDPSNYELQFSRHNRSAGGGMGANGPWWIPSQWQG